MAHPSVYVESAMSARDAEWRPWMIWALGSLFFFLSIFERVSTSVMVGDLMRDFAVGAAVLGNLSAFYYYAYAGMQIPVGVTLDRFGPRVMMTFAAAMAAVGCLMFALAPGVLVAGIGRTLIGAGCAFAWIGSMKLIAIWFPSNRFAQIMGLTSMLGMLGGAAGQSPLAVAVEAVGWRATQVGAAVAAALLGLAIWFIVRDTRPNGPAQTVGRFTARAAIGVLRTPQTWIAGVIIAAVGAILMAFVGLWCVPFLIEAYGLERTTAAAASSMFLVGWAIGAPVLGWISDRAASRKRPILVGGIICFAAVLTLIFVPGLPAWSIYALLLTSGFAGSTSIIAFAVIREINRPEDVATAIAVSNLLPMALSAGLQPLMGWILDLQWTGRILDGARLYDVGAYRVAFLILVVCGVACIAASLMIRETNARSVVGPASPPSAP